MIDKTITRILKVGKFEHIHSLYEEGLVYCNPIEFFKICEKEDARFDKSEAATNITQVSQIILQGNNGEEFTFSKEPKEGEIKLNSAFKYDHIHDFNGNLFCCTAVHPDIKDFIEFDARFADFGDTILLIEKPMRFVIALQDCLKSLNLGYKMDLVKYYDKKSHDGILDFFSKPNEYSFQNELRLFIENDQHEPITLKLPPLKEYSSLFKLEDILSLNKK
ncbi:hypothetical protein D3C71_69840 [compost metagenome]